MEDLIIVIKEQLVEPVISAKQARINAETHKFKIAKKQIEAILKDIKTMSLSGYVSISVKAVDEYIKESANCRKIIIDYLKNLEYSIEYIGTGYFKIGW